MILILYSVAVFLGVPQPYDGGGLIVPRWTGGDYRGMVFGIFATPLTLSLCKGMPGSYSMRTSAPKSCSRDEAVAAAIQSEI